MPEVLRRLSAIPHQLTRPFHWAARVESSGQFAWSLLLADALLAGCVILILDGYWLAQHLDLKTVAVLATGLIPFHLVCFTYVPARPLGWPWSALKIAVASAFALWIFPQLFGVLQIHLARGAFGRVLATFAPLQLLLHLAHLRRRAATPLEPLRWTLLAAGGMAVSFPFRTSNSIGTADAYWYANMVADFTTQWRAGIFPVFVGQSDYAFNGAVSPLRFAPYLQHFAGVVDLVTFHTLTFVGQLNFTLLASLMAATFTCYAALLAVDRNIRWLALCLSLLFVASPGVLALAYSWDLFLSICTLPYLPFVMFGIWATFQRADVRSVCILAVALAATWLCHPPIAFWAVIIATLSQLIRLANAPRDPRAWRGWLAGAVVFVALTGYTFVAVLTLKLPPQPVDPRVIVNLLTDVFPDIFFPVSEGVTGLSDFQLGWSLWAVLFVGLALGLLKRRRAFSLTLGLSCALLLILLLPIPHVLRPLWEKAMPQVVCNLTFMWPMQRFYVLLGIMAVFLGYTGFAVLTARWPRLQIALVIALLPALAWSGSEASAFIKRGIHSTSADGVTQVARLPQNRILTRYAYNPFPCVPPYFSHGYVDPLLENRLLAIGSLAEVTSNHRALLGAAATIVAEGPVQSRHYGPQSAFYELFTALPIDPGRRYAMELVLAHPDLTGSLIVSGATVHREYFLPDSGVGMPIRRPATSFGSLPTSARSFSLWTNAEKTEPLLLQFITSVPLERDITEFGHYVLREFDPKRLPIAVETWTPYRARVVSPAPAWLETPRQFVDGYRATVNSKEVLVARSPDDLVMVPVGTGESRVKLTYPGPLSLRLSYFFSLAAWAVVTAVGLLMFFWRNKTAPPA
ncbi:MAG: hypothetical protein EXS39_00025 [Opitutaceae bacterium]|nr:hypothetical protein [Opitutaceae bacterium]